MLSAPPPPGTPGPYISTSYRSQTPDRCTELTASGLRPGCGEASDLTCSPSGLSLEQGSHLLGTLNMSFSPSALRGPAYEAPSTRPRNLHQLERERSAQSPAPW